MNAYKALGIILRKVTLSGIDVDREVAAIRSHLEHQKAEIERLNGQLADARDLLRQLREHDNAEIDEPWYSSPLPHYLRADIDALLGEE